LWQYNSTGLKFNLDPIRNIIIWPKVNIDSQGGSLLSPSLLIRGRRRSKQWYKIDKSERSKSWNEKRNHISYFSSLDINELGRFNSIIVRFTIVVAAAAAASASGSGSSIDNTKSFQLILNFTWQDGIHSTTTTTTTTLTT